MTYDHPASGNGIGLPAETLPELHDSICLALDAIAGPELCQRTLLEARGYLRDALNHIGGAA
ncbi:hypothetical protein LCM08_00550 [Salipiger pacificus]|nr:hypothetical protein [Alloyangia pacifica]